MNEIVLTAIVSVLGGGGCAAFITQFFSRKKTSAEASATNIEAILKIDNRLNEKVLHLEKLVARLEAECRELKHENFLLKELMRKYENLN